MIRFAGLLRPTRKDVIFYAVMSAAILVTGNFRRIGHLAGNGRTVDELLDALGSGLGQILGIVSSVPHAADGVTFFVWLAAGSAAFAILVAAMDFIREAGFDLTADWKFVHPRGYHKGDYLKELIRRLVIRTAAIYGIASYAVIFMKYLLPAWIGQLAGFLAEPLDITGVWRLPLSLAGMIFGLHIAKILLRMQFVARI